MRKHLTAYVACLAVLAGCGVSNVESIAPTHSAETPTSGNDHYIDIDALDVVVPVETPFEPGLVGVGPTAAWPQCGGIPIKNTTYVVTAVHCVLMASSKGPQLKYLVVSQNGEKIANVVGVHIDVRYLADDAFPAYDTAVITTDTYFAFGADRIGTLDESDTWYAYGIQRIGLDGQRLVPEDNGPSVCSVYDCSLEPEIRRHQNDIATFHKGVAYCAGDVDGVDRHDDAFWVNCGMVPGASGGPVVVYLNTGETVLVGTISTVNQQHTLNGVAPASHIDDLYNKARHFLYIGNPLYSPADTYASSGYMDAAERMARNRIGS